MRLFYQLDAHSPNWNEITLSKFTTQKSDIIFCHSVALRDRLFGEGLLVGQEYDARVPDCSKTLVTKNPESIIFYTKPPLTAKYSVGDKDVSAIIDFGSDWLEV